MAKKELVENIVKLYSKLGGNMSDVLGSRSNVTFLGTGKNPEPFVDMSINMEAVGALGKSKVLDELKSPMGYLTADKLNDVQAGKLYENMLKLDEFYNPRQVTNITDMATRTRNLDQEGLGALRARGDYMTDEGVMASETILPVGSQVAKRNKEGVMAFDDLDEIAEPFQSAEETFRKLEAQGQGDLARQLQKAMMEGPLSKVGNKGDTPAKRSSAREFLVEALKKDETDVGTAAFGKVNLNNVISAEDVKYITEGGGGIGGDPILLVEKYFGPRIAEALPAGATGDEIIIFTNRVLENVTDAAGLKPDNPRFDRMTARFVDIKFPGGPEQPFADGGRAGFRYGGDTMGGPNDRSIGGEGPDRTKVSDVQNLNHQAFVQMAQDYNRNLNNQGGGDGPKVGITTIETPQSKNINTLTKTGLLNDEEEENNLDNLALGITNMDKVLANKQKTGQADIFAELGLKYAEGGRAGFRFGRSAGKAFGLMKKAKAIEKSVDAGEKMGYQALRDYGLEAEDITRLFRELAMDKTMVSAEKTAYFKMLNQVLKNPDDFPDGIIEIKKRLGMDFAKGGLAKILEV
jgi:hypothetical protein